MQYRMRVAIFMMDAVGATDFADRDRPQYDALVDELGISEQARRMCPFVHWASAERPPNFDPVSPLYVYPGTRRHERASVQNAHASTTHIMASGADEALVALERAVSDALASEADGRRRPATVRSEAAGPGAAAGSAN